MMMMITCCHTGAAYSMVDWTTSMRILLLPVWSIFQFINIFLTGMSGITSASIGSATTLGTGNPGAVELMDAAGGRALKFQTDTPHLVNIGGDRLSTSVTLHPIPQDF
ncbi:unnamed protein product [Diabrotica balteata]|uniref:Uncharacterized protein n=1 Tax=Diabrotica balteata TaxID=107213 RepID=A0A9N9TB25_DIABA|nr:unnamed protein product [Diabrotica balteata]